MLRIPERTAGQKYSGAAYPAGIERMPKPQWSGVVLTRTSPDAQWANSTVESDGGYHHFGKNAPFREQWSSAYLGWAFVTLRNIPPQRVFPGEFKVRTGAQWSMEWKSWLWGKELPRNFLWYSHRPARVLGFFRGENWTNGRLPQEVEDRLREERRFCGESRALEFHKDYAMGLSWELQALTPIRDDEIPGFFSIRFFGLLFFFILVCYGLFFFFCCCCFFFCFLFFGCVSCLLCFCIFCFFFFFCVFLWFFCFFVLVWFVWWFDIFFVVCWFFFWFLGFCFVFLLFLFVVFFCWVVFIFLFFFGLLCVFLFCFLCGVFLVVVFFVFLFFVCGNFSSSEPNPMSEWQNCKDRLT